MAGLSDEDWEEIGAYVDGELDGARRRAVQRRLSHDPAYAAALAEVHRAKAALSLLRPEVGMPDRAWAGRLPRFRSRMRLAAAAIVLLALLGAALFVRPGAGERWTAVPVQLHAELVRQSYLLPGRSPLPVVSTARIGDVVVPDLGASRLFLVDVRTSERMGREVVAMHYRGRNGCRLTLVAIEALPGETAEPSPDHDGLAARWTVFPVHYYLLADGMDRRRFEAIAAFARTETGRTRRDSLRLALEEATKGARPCRAGPSSVG